MRFLTQMLAIGGAGFVGAVLRWLIGLAFGRWPTTGFPVATMFINVSGSFFLGWFLTFATGRMQFPDTLRLAIGTGFVGAYTTFSTYMWESTRLSNDGAGLAAFVNLLGSLLLGLLAVRLGIVLAKPN